MENNLNKTQDGDKTQNPQQNSVPSEGASNAEDFQSTAPQDALNSQTENLSVQSNGDPITAASSSVQSNSITLVVIFSLFVVVAIILLLSKLLKESGEDNRQADIVNELTSETKAIKYSEKPSVSKKKSNRKKSAPNQRRKKTAKNKR